MKAQRECFACLANQMKRFYPQGLDSKLEKFLSYQNEARLSPPQIAISLYGDLREVLGKEDPFKEIKQKSIKKAFALLQDLKIEEMSLEQGMKLSALGNVIDYGSQNAFCIESFDFAQALRDLDFACFEFESFQLAIKQAKSLVMLGDNAGENLFDERLLRIFARDFPELKLYYFVRGEPIINDITLKDLQEFEECRGIFEIAEVVDSGMKSPGFIYEDANLKAREIFDRADLILSKGMGNFECLEGSKISKIFFLLKIKCQVVARQLKMPLGKMVLKQNILNLW